MPKPAVVLAFLLFVIMAAPLGAQEVIVEELPYPPYNMNIPAGWAADYDPGSGDLGQTLTLTSPDRAANFRLRIEPITDGGWEAMMNRMELNPAPDHGPPTIYDADNFVVSFNDITTDSMGRSQYTRLDAKRCLVQTSRGNHPDLGGLWNAVTIEEKTLGTN